jgi:hypothetical protein
MSEESAISPENAAVVKAATLRMVNQAVEQRVKDAAQAEHARAHLERRVWRWALVATLCLVLLGATFASLSARHLL